MHEAPEDLISSKIDVRDTADHRCCFFTSDDWYRNLIETVIDKDGDRVLFVPCRPDCVPLKVKAHGAGVSMASLSNYYSPIYRFLDDCAQVDAVNAFFNQISQFNWHTLELRPMPESDVWALTDCLGQLQRPCVPFFCFGNWYLPVNGRCYDDYFASLSTRVRNTVSRKTRAFYRQSGARIEVFSSLAELPEALAAYNQVYQASWKQPEPYPDFIPGLMGIAADRQALRVAVAYLDHQPIAAQLWLVADQTAYIFKLAYDQRYKPLSAGTVLTAHLLRQVLDQDKVAVVDYLSGDDAYKQDWMSHRRERWGVRVFNPRTLSGCYDMMRELPKYRLKRLLKRGR